MKFDVEDLGMLWRPNEDSHGDQNGLITIIGGSELFQGAPLMSVLAASRLVDTVFLATPTTDKGILEKEALFSVVRPVIWVPREDIDAYIVKSDAVLIGPGMMRYRAESTKHQIPRSIQVANPNVQNHKLDTAGQYTSELTKDLLGRFPEKKWVIDGGSLQTIDPRWIPPGAIVTPNMNEYRLLFNDQFSVSNLQINAEKYRCVIVAKDKVTYVSDGETTYELDGGNAGLTKGGTGDVLAGVVVGLLAKNEPLLAAVSGAFLVKRTAEKLFLEYGYGYNADDLAKEVFEVKKGLVGV